MNLSSQQHGILIIFILVTILYILINTFITVPFLSVMGGVCIVLFILTFFNILKTDDEKNII